MMLFDNEVAASVALRRKGRTFSYIAEEIGVCRDVIGRELRAQGIATGHINPSSRIGGFFRSALDIDQQVSRKGLHYRGVFRNALAAILAGCRGTSEYDAP